MDQMTLPDLGPEVTPAPPAVPSNDDAGIMRVLVRVLTRRALGASYAVLAFALGCWAMVDPLPMRAMIAGGFAVFALLSQLLTAWAER